MKTLILNGSPRKNGTVSKLLHTLADNVSTENEIEWIDVYDLNIKPCLGCMKCRDTHECVLPVDDGQKVGEKMGKADVLVIGSPTYWGNMSGVLKILFERNVYRLMGEGKHGIPVPLQKGKKAVIVTACTTPAPFSYLFKQSRGTVHAIKEILKYAGYKTTAKIIKAGSKSKPEISKGLMKKTIRAAKSL